MKLKIYYENHSQFLEVDTDEMWSCLGFEDTNVPTEEKERMIQDKVNKEWNNPDYNNWLKFNKHRTFIDGEKALEKIADLYGAEQAFKNLDYKETCKKLYEVFGKHKEWAELVIKIALDGYKTIDVAKEKGVTREVISHKYRRAINFLKNVYKKRPVLWSPKVYI